jgi:6-phosphogluconolactonase
LLPAVHAAAPSTLIITDGFSCREQIVQTTERRSLHLAEVIQMALQENAGLNVTPGRHPSTHGIGSSARSWAPAGGRETADGDQLAQGKGSANHLTANQQEIIVCDNGPAVSRRAADLLVLAAQAATTLNGQFTIALSGGPTPTGLYTLVAQEPYRSRIPWTQVHVFWGDERCVPPDHPDSNYRLAHDALLAHVPIPAGNIHRISPELRDCKLAAAWYAQELAAFFQLQPGTFPCFDLILLGIGEDGHTASLFPGMPGLEERQALAVATPPGRLPPAVDRVTLTLPVLNAAHHIVFLVTGEGKAGIIRQILTDTVSASSPELLPAQLVRPTDGTVTWILDKSAGQLLG